MRNQSATVGSCLSMFESVDSSLEGRVAHIFSECVSMEVRTSRVSPATANERTKGKPNAHAARKGGKAAPKAAKARKAAMVKACAPVAREGSKKAIIIGMLARGATLSELMAATGWQAHSVRGFLSTAAKKQGLTIESTRNKTGERFYRIAK